MSEPRRRLLLSQTDKKLAGVCGGLAEYFDVDSTLVRIIFLVLTVFSLGMGGILLYLILWAVMPKY